MKDVINEIKESKGKEGKVVALVGFTLPRFRYYHFIHTFVIIKFGYFFTFRSSD